MDSMRKTADLWSFLTHYIQQVEHDAWLTEERRKMGKKLWNVKQSRDDACKEWTPKWMDHTSLAQGQIQFHGLRKTQLSSLPAGQKRTWTVMCVWRVSSCCLFFPSQQTGEYATDEEETATTVAGGDKSIEVFDLPETEDILSPSELDANKLYQKFREVNATHHCVKITQLARDHHIFLWQRFQE